MASPAVTVKTQAVARLILAKLVGNNQPMIKLLENLTEDVSSTLPTGVDVATALAQAAQAAADEVTGLFIAEPGYGSDIDALRRSLDEAHMQIQAMRQQLAELDKLRRQVNELQAYSFAS